MAMESLSQLRQVVVGTGTFLVAWSWCLVYYAASHIFAGESPLEKQIGFGGQGQPQKIAVLLGQYLIVCGIVWALLVQLKRHSSPCVDALSTSLEFFPSPIFSGALNAYLSQFHGGGLESGVMNLAASWIIAAMVSIAPSYGSFKSLGDIVKKTVGFGLGVAWNILASGFEPLSTNLVARTVYVIFTLLLAASLAVPQVEETTLRQRHASLLSFASMVVCAFALSDWLGVVMPSGYMGNVYSIIVLILLAAVFSEMVIEANFSSQFERQRDPTYKKSGLGKLVSCLVLIPCVWCCFPCVPLIWMLSGTQDVSEAAVKNRWLGLISTVTSLAASVVGTNIMTSALDDSAVTLDICDTSGKCDDLVFLIYSMLLAFLVSLGLLAAVVPLVERKQLPMDELPVEGHVALLENA
jgi:hypothetical protein